MRIELDMPIEVRVSGGWKSGWLRGTVVNLIPVKVKLDCDGYTIPIIENDIRYLTYFRQFISNHLWEKYANA